MSDDQLDLGLSDEDRAVPAPGPTDVRPSREIPQLDEESIEILNVERQWFMYAGRKEAVIREKFGITTTQFYQRLNTLIDEEAALAFDPILVKRLRVLRKQRQRSRSARRLGIDL